MKVGFWIITKILSISFSRDYTISSFDECYTESGEINTSQKQLLSFRITRGEGEDLMMMLDW